jgi:hypothetical protein
MFYNSPTSILAVIWGAILLLVFIVSLFTYLGRRSKYRMLERLAEKGQTLSPEMLASLGSLGNGHNANGKNPLTSGIMLMCIGVALTIFFWATTDFEDLLHGGAMPTVIGIIPFMVGLARVISARIDRRDSNK